MLTIAGGDRAESISEFLSAQSPQSHSVAAEGNRGSESKSTTGRVLPPSNHNSLRHGSGSPGKRERGTALTWRLTEGQRGC
jgi:hypothetical protein